MKVFKCPVCGTHYAVDVKVRLNRMEYCYLAGHWGPYEAGKCETCGLAKNDRISSCDWKPAKRQNKDV